MRLTPGWTRARASRGRFERPTHARHPGSQRVQHGAVCLPRATPVGAHLSFLSRPIHLPLASLAAAPRACGSRRPLLSPSVPSSSPSAGAQVKENFDIAVSTIQKCAQRNIIHKNKSNRLVSRLSLKFNAFRRGEDPKTQAVSQKPKADTSLFAQQLAEYEEYAASLQAA